MGIHPEELQNYIEPADLTGDLALVRDLCGDDTAKLLAIKLSGISIYIPATALQQGRLRLMTALLGKGWSYKRIAAYLGVSDRWIRRQLEQTGTQDDQLCFKLD